MVAYLLFCILCVLLATFAGVLAFWLWLIVTVVIVCWSIVREVFLLLYRAWDRATTDKEI
jgi:hypothetical protein